jgi:hypothetical protein
MMMALQAYCTCAVDLLAPNRGPFVGYFYHKTLFVKTWRHHVLHQGQQLLTVYISAVFAGFLLDAVSFMLPS